LRLKTGDTYRLLTQGGGGWGDPLKRDINMVLEDVRNEKVSVKRAKEAYGVVIHPKTLEIDVQATQLLRETMKSKGGGGE